MRAALVLLLLAGPAFADEAPRYELAGNVLKVITPGGTKDVALGCDGRGLARAGEKIYAACGARSGS